MPGNKVYVQGSYVDIHDNENVYLSIDKAEVHTQTTGTAKKTTEKPETEGQESKEVLFKFIHPAITGEQELQIHKEVKNLVSRYTIPEICSYLKGMAKEKRIMLPPQSLTAYEELVRMGMPNGEGFSLKTFQNNYSR